MPFLTPQELIQVKRLLQAASGGSVAWTSVTGKPSTFPPDSHTHPQSDVTGLVTDLSNKAALVHTHAQSDITGLVAALAGKSDTGHTHAQSDITNLVTDLSNKAALSHTHTASQVTDFNTAADARIAAASINALSDVVITSASTGQVLKFNGTNWINDTDATGGGGGGYSSPLNAWLG
jgi:hypothetical protein